MSNLTINKMKKGKKKELNVTTKYEVVTRDENFGIEIVVGIYRDYKTARSYANDLFRFHQGTPLANEVVFVRCVTISSQVLLQFKTVTYEHNENKCLSSRPSKRRKGQRNISSSSRG